MLAPSFICKTLGRGAGIPQDPHELERPVPTHPLSLPGLAVGASSRTGPGVDVHYSEAMSCREREAAGEGAVLRITIQDQASVMSFVVEGKLAGP